MTDRPFDEPEDDVTRWPVVRLIDHIVSTHHVYVREALPAIGRHLRNLCEAHGDRHPELARVASVFDAIAGELSFHLIKEERVLFPYIRELAEHVDPNRCAARLSPFGSVENPIRMMEREHRAATDDLRVIRTLTHDYAVPADGSAAYAVAMGQLALFERDLYRHIDLENNVLFPRAVALEGGSFR